MARSSDQVSDWPIGYRLSYAINLGLHTQCKTPRVRRSLPGVFATRRRWLVDYQYLRVEVRRIGRPLRRGLLQLRLAQQDRQEGAGDADRTGDPERRTVTPGVDHDRAQAGADQT